MNPARRARVAALPSGFALRSARRNDLSELLDLVQAYDLADSGRSGNTHEHLRDDWRRPRFNPARDAWVVQDALGRAAAFAHAYEEQPGRAVDVMVRVHPRDRGRGLGTFLVDVAEARVAARARATRRPLLIWNSISASDAGAAAILGRAGYEVVRAFLHMEAALDVRPRPLVPTEVVIGEFDARRDARLAHALLERAFQGHWGIAPVSFGDWCEQFLSPPAFDPSVWRVARVGRAMAGVATAEIIGSMGWILDIGVAGRWRRRGIGRALLESCFEAFYDKGVRVVSLNVDAANPTGAPGLYERVGMTVVRRWSVLQKTVNP